MIRMGELRRNIKETFTEKYNRYLIQGEINFYHDNGKLHSTEEGTFKSLKLEGKGEMNFYHDNGKLEQTQKGTFKSDTLEQGKIYFYDEKWQIRTNAKRNFQTFKARRPRRINFLS